jgi:hypothetical protein
MSVRETQCARILDLLKERAGTWVPLPTILDLHIAQYNARIFQLRANGHNIENKIERGDDGQVRSWYRLLIAPQQLQLLVMPTDLRKSA